MTSSIDDEQLCPDIGVGAVRLRIVCDLVAHSRLEGVFPAIFELSMELTLEAEEYVSFDAPMIGEIARRVLNHANADAPEVLSTPEG
jgi:hypothetical protein